MTAKFRRRRFYNACNLFRLRSVVPKGCSEVRTKSVVSGSVRLLGFRICHTGRARASRAATWPAKTLRCCLLPSSPLDHAEDGNSLLYCRFTKKGKTCYNRPIVIGETQSRGYYCALRGTWFSMTLNDLESCSIPKPPWIKCHRNVAFGCYYMFVIVYWILSLVIATLINDYWRSQKLR